MIVTVTHNARYLVMNKSKFGLLLLLVLSLLGCTPEPYSAKVGYNNGSTSGAHWVSNMVVTTVSGGAVSFSMGAIGTYPGAASSGGRMDAPAHVEGLWVKGWDYPFESYHRISMDIPKDAEAKMKLMDNYYQNIDKDYGSMQVIVDGPRVRVFYTKNCFSKFDDCTPKQNIDPNNWVIKSPSGTTDVVKLFDGIGESSKTPFANTHFEEIDKRKKME